MVYEEAVVTHGIEATCASPNGIEAKCASPRWRPNPEIDWHRDRYPRDMINPAGRNHVNRQRSPSSNAKRISALKRQGVDTKKLWEFLMKRHDVKYFEKSEHDLMLRTLYCLRLLPRALCFLLFVFKIAGDKFLSSVCIYEKSMQEVRRLIPKVREIFTAGRQAPHVSASIIERAKRCLKYTTLQRIVLLHELLTIARGLKLAK